MKNSFQKEEGTMQAVGDRFINVLRSVGYEAWDELKSGIDKAWDEVRLGLDDGIQTAATGMNKAWNELAEGIERAKDSLLLNDNSNRTTNKSGGSGKSDISDESADDMTPSKRSRKTSRRDKDKLS